MSQDPSKRAVVRNVLQSALSSLQVADLEKMVATHGDDVTVIVTNKDTASKIARVFGNASEPFVQIGMPTWVEYKDHRPPQNWTDISEQLRREAPPAQPVVQRRAPG